MARRFWTQELEEEGMSEFKQAGEEVVEVHTQAAKYLQDSDSESEDSGVKRVVKPMKEKLLEEMTDSIDQMKKAMQIYDCVSLQESFDKINKQLGKVMRIVDSVPNIYIKALIMLEGFVNQTLASKEAKKNMSSGNAKVLNSMKLKLKKKNKQYEELVNEYREKPECEEHEEEDWEFVEDPMKLDFDWDEDEDADENEDEETETDSEWRKIMSGKAKLVDDQFRDSPSKLTWDTVTKRFKEIVAAKQEKKGTGRIKLLEQGKRGKGRILVDPQESLTRVHIISRDVKYSFIYYHE